MRLVTFQQNGSTRVGVQEGDVVADLGAVRGTPRDMLALIAHCAEHGLQAVSNWASEAPRIPLATVTLLAPIPRPAKNIFCVGKNYHEHAHEFHRSGFDASAGNQAIPDLPIVFSKPATTVIGPNVPIPRHLDPTDSVDYETELAIVIGRGGRGISKGQAFDHVLGYTIVNDVTARTLQQRHKQWLLGKGIDGFCPMGPAIVTADAIADIGALRVRTHVNGELRQNAQVRQLIFDIPTLIACISQSITLEPGDIIATGTPAGVGIGFTPPRFLRQGDVVVSSIDELGELSNPVS